MAVMTMSRHRHLSAAATVCAVLLVTGCGGSRETSVASTPGPEPAASRTAQVEVLPGDGTFVQADDADRSDVESTAEVAALMLHSWDTATDRTQTAAAVRAKPLMSKEWASNQIEPERNGAQGAWLEAGRHEAYSSPSIIPAAGDVSRDVAEDRAVRVYDVNWRWISRDGTEIQSTGHQLVTVYLEELEGDWEVVGHQLQVPAS